jgi:Zn-dependent M28 family amino/carboxypeptidase
VQICAWAAAISTVPLVLCFTGNKSAGAVDNASGLVSVLLATRSLSAHLELGVIVTSGEELGLAGARAYVESSPQRARAINCDTIDDGGRFLCMARRGSRGVVTVAVVRAAARLGLPLRVRGIIPGILADSIAFADAGWDAVSVSRGNIATLARVHTSSDTRDRLTGSGIAQTARLIAATVEELT